MTNGTPDPLEGWEIWLVEGKTLLGCPRTSKEYGEDFTESLSPVYELIVQVQVTREGFTRAIGCSPLLWFASIRSIEAVGYPKISVSDLSNADKAAIRKALCQADEFIRMQRAADAGILVANKMPDVKP